MIRRPPRSTRTDTLFPYPTLFRSPHAEERAIASVSKHESTSFPRVPMRDPRYDILFEPVQIGPVTARNRFYQVPHCCGMGYRYPASAAAMRGVKAEGGWAVVATEEAEIHPSAEVAPFVENRIWDDQDLPHLKALTEAVHRSEEHTYELQSLMRLSYAVF